MNKWLSQFDNDYCIVFDGNPRFLHLLINPDLHAEILRNRKILKINPIFVSANDDELEEVWIVCVCVWSAHYICSFVFEHHAFLF